MKKNLIIGYATNADFSKLLPFLITARKWHDPDLCDIVIFVSALQGFSDANANASKLKVALLPATSLWRGKKSLRRRIIGRLALRLLSTAAPRAENHEYGAALASWLHPHYTRWYDYLRFLAVNTEYDKVFISDVTDVYFQGNAFTHMSQAHLTCAAQPVLYGEKNLDTDWLIASAGEEASKRYFGKPAVCIGTLGAPHHQALAVCRELWSDFSTRPHRGIEQAVFNELLYSDKLGPYELKHNSDGFALTITSMEECPGLHWDGNLRLNATAAPPVVHMFNRLSPALSKSVAESWA